MFKSHQEIYKTIGQSANIELCLPSAFNTTKEIYIDDKKYFPKVTTNNIYIDIFNERYTVNLTIQVVNLTKNDFRHYGVKIKTYVGVSITFSFVIKLGKLFYVSILFNLGRRGPMIELMTDNTKVLSSDPKVHQALTIPDSR